MPKYRFTQVRVVAHHDELWLEAPTATEAAVKFAAKEMEDEEHEFDWKCDVVTNVREHWTSALIYAEDGETYDRHILNDRAQEEDE